MSLYESMGISHIEFKNLPLGEVIVYIDTLAEVRNVKK